MYKIHFIVQQLSQPRCIKRIEDVASSGFSYDVYGFDNGLYSENLKHSNITIKTSRPIDKRANKLYKIRAYYKLVKYVLSVTNKDDIIYCFGFELGAICSLINFKCKYIYEEADLTASRYTNILLKKLLIILDKHIIRRSAFTIFTSRCFPKYIYGDKKFESDKIIYIENKLHTYFHQVKRYFKHTIDLENITFGYIGLIRYPNTIIRFARVIAKYFPQHKFYFYGDMDGNYIDLEEWSKYQNVIFRGKFRNPMDLERIYSEIDINIACYDTLSDNVKVAEPNKLYESMFFIKPIIVSSGTYLANRVNEYKAGFAIDASKDESIINFIQSIDPETVTTIINSISNVLKEELISNNVELPIKLKKILHN